MLFTAGAALVMDRAGRRLLLALSGEARLRLCQGGPARLPLQRVFAEATVLAEEEDRCP